MGDPIINSQVDAINTTLGNIKVDLAALRPSIRAIKDAIAETYLTDTIENVPIASFNDGADGIPVRELQVAIEPVQDLNGYDNPWPAGGGPNLYTGTYTPATQLYLSPSSPYAVTRGVASERSIIMPCLSNTKYIVRSGMQGTLRAGSFTSTPVEDSNPTVFATASSSTNPTSLTITTGASDEYMFIQFFINGDVTNYGCTLEGCLTGFYYAVYENICPITGHTEVNVYRTGKNLYDDSTIIHGSFTNASVAIHPTEAYRTVKLTLPAGTYTFSCDLENCFIIRGVWDGTVHVLNRTVTRYTFTSTEEGTVAFCFRNTSTSTITDTVHAQVEIGSTATAYEPYTGDTYNIPLGQTVYGGTLNVTTGVLTIDRAMVALNGSESISVKNTGTANWYYSFDTVLSSAEAKNTVNDISSDYPRASITNGNTNQGFTSSGPWIRVRWGAEDTVANYKAWLANNPLQVCYFLATPTTVQLTAAEVETLFGQNNVWCSSGNIIKLTYRKAWEIALAEGE